MGLAQKAAGVPPPAAKPITGPRPVPMPLLRLRLSGVVQDGETVRVALVDESAKPPKLYNMAVDETQDGITVIEADAEAGRVLLRKDGVGVWIDMKGRKVAPGVRQAIRPPGKPVAPGVIRKPAGTNNAGAAVKNAGDSVKQRQPVSYSERLRQRREALRAKQEAVTKLPRMTSEELEEHLQKYNPELIRKANVPLPIPLTPEQDAQLVKEGVLPPLKQQPSPPAPAPALPPAFVKNLRLVGMVESREGVFAGYVDVRSKPTRSYVLKVGESAQDVTLLDADYARRCVLLRKGDQQYWLSMTGLAPGDRPAKPPLSDLGDDEVRFSFTNAPLQTVFDCYSELSKRVVIAAPALPKVSISMDSQTPVSPDSCLAAMRQKLSESKVRMRDSGEQFCFATQLIPGVIRVLPPDTTALSEAVVATPQKEGLRFELWSCPIEIVLDDLGEKLGRTLLLAPGLPRCALTLKSPTDLSLMDYVQAIEKALHLHNVSLTPVDEKFLLVAPARLPASCPAVLEVQRSRALPDAILSLEKESPAQAMRVMFHSAPLDVVVHWVAETFGREVLMAPELPNARITLASRGDSAPGELLQAVEFVLKMHGIQFAIIDDAWIAAVPREASGAASTDSIFHEVPLGSVLSQHARLRELAFSKTGSIPDISVDTPMPEGRTAEAYIAAVETVLKGHGLEFVRENEKRTKVLHKGKEIGVEAAKSTIAKPAVAKPGIRRIPASTNRAGAAVKSAGGTTRPPQTPSYAERRRRRLEEMRQRAAKAQKITPEQVEKHLQDYQMDLIRKGLPPLPIPLTPDMDDQLVAEGVLPPLEPAAVEKEAGKPAPPPKAPLPPIAPAPKPTPAPAARVRARHILVKELDDATAIRKKLLEGGDFSKLAQEHSICPSKKQGGDLGTFGKGQMVPEFEKAAFSQKPGVIGDVVKTKFGYHIVEVLGRE